jgi:hypothetical protein
MLVQVFISGCTNKNGNAQSKSLMKVKANEKAN